MRRREFTAVIGGAVAAWPFVGNAQQSERIRRVGVLMPWPENNARANVTAFTKALERFGWVEGKNIRLDYRFASGDPILFKTYAAELVGISPDAILASTAPAVLALRLQTHTIPIVFALVTDPVGLGLVQSFSHPGGNLTGFGAVDLPIMGKWFQLLKEVAPSVVRVAVIFNPDTQPYAPAFNRLIETAGSKLQVTVTLAPVRNDASIEQAAAALAREPGGGLISLPDSFTSAHRVAIAAAAARHRLPLISLPDLVRAGGLISYWFNPVDVHAQAASYIDRILRGANPADLPVQQPTKYSLIINLKTAKALGLTVPPSMLDLADEVIE